MCAKGFQIKGVVMQDVPMKRYTSMKVGGPVKYLIYPLDESDLIAALTHLKQEGIRYRFFGNGTNVIVDDRGINEAVIRITRMVHTRHRATENGAYVDVAGGVSLRTFILHESEKGLSGLEKLYWIPGTIGGAIKMNAGSFGSTISDTLEAIRIINGQGIVKTVPKNELLFGYRTSSVHTSECVVSARFYLTARDKKAIQKDMAYVYGERKKRHPMEFPSSGSIFKQVHGTPAWKFIEQAGLKGYQIGGAQVSQKHANFIINRGYATAQDIKRLIDTIKKEVFEKLGVTLHEEVELWGFDG